ncbi:hypothetical protein IFM89_019913, partial [Coptis chinensis]
FLYHSLPLSAWKSIGLATWSLRVNPSSGNLHPTETYIICPPINSLFDSPFVAHYALKEHSLELRAKIPLVVLEFFPKGYFLVGLSSIFWREAWKYGERAFRYCNHDVGHAIGSAELGWDVKVLDGLGYSDLEKLMGLDYFPTLQIPSRPVKGKLPEIEFEHPDCVIVVFPNDSKEFSVDYKSLSSLITESLSELEWIAREVVRKRRSAVDMDGVHVMKRETFYQILLHCLPSGSRGGGEKQGKQLALPFRVLPWDSEVHAVIFVHRVVGLPKGVYFLVRNEDHFHDLKQATRSEFEWVKPEGCPADLPFYMLTRGDFQQIAKRLSCHQQSLRDKNVWMYPRLFWETGILGQVLYLEAHAVGISATGIGCYFDDAGKSFSIVTCSVIFFL